MKSKTSKKVDQEDEFFSDKESENEAQSDQEQDEESKSGENEGDKKPVKVRNVVRKPQPKLDANRLCGPRGLKCCLDLFKDFKPKGDGHEFRDLDIIMAKYEYWAHRLFPKMKFIDVIDRLEKLGEKREVKHLLNSIRLGEQVTESQVDPLAEDETRTAHLMNMMNQLDDSHDDENDENQLDMDSYFGGGARKDSSTKNKVVEDEDEDEDEIFNRLLEAKMI